MKDEKSRAQRALQNDVSGLSGHRDRCSASKDAGYKMKLEAIKHQGVASSQVGKKLLSIEKVGEDSGESRNQVHRYIRLTYLIPELLEW